MSARHRPVRAFSPMGFRAGADSHRGKIANPPPPWFVALVALVLWYVLRATLPADTPVLPAPQLAFFGWLVPLAAAIYSGIKAVGELGLFLLYQMIQGLWKAFGNIYNAAVEIGKGVLHSFSTAWRFLKELYTNVLQPAWTKFWTWIDRARHWLENFFKPIFEFLQHIREEILKFYNRFVKPVLDTIEIARKFLSVFKALGFEWAKALDAQLARIEDKINEPFLFALQKLNEVINVIDRIVTADGLFQRLALLKSIERDIKYIHQQLQHWRSNPLTSRERNDLLLNNQPPTREQLSDNFDRYLSTGSGPLAEYDDLVDVSGTIFASAE